MDTNPNNLNPECRSLKLGDTYSHPPQHWILEQDKQARRSEILIVNCNH